MTDAPDRIHAWQTGIQPVGQSSGLWDSSGPATHLRATPVREHAEELLEAAADLLHEIDRFFREDDACWLDGVDPGPAAQDRLRTLLAKIEGKT